MTLLASQDIPPTTTFSLITELINRDGLRTALSGRDDVSLEPVLRFLIRNITDTRFGNTASQVSLVVIGTFLCSSSLLGVDLHIRCLDRSLTVRSSSHRILFLDLYSSIMGQSPLIDDLFVKLQRKINDELRVQRDVLIGLKGMVEMVLGNAMQSRSTPQEGEPVLG